MLPFAYLIAALVLSPSAMAASVALGPDGLASPERGEPYYVWLVVGSPEGPGMAEPTDDCGAGSRPALLAAPGAIAADVAAWDPFSNFGGGTWFPTCVSGTALECDGSAGTPCTPAPVPMKAYVAYDVTTGRYYLELDSAALPGMPSPASLALTGTTGMGLLMDCVGCPPPVCCDH